MFIKEKQTKPMIFTTVVSLFNFLMIELFSRELMSDNLKPCIAETDIFKAGMISNTKLIVSERRYKLYG